jgi:hypothetical protein
MILEKWYYWSEVFVPPEPPRVPEAQAIEPLELGAFQRFC